MNSAAFFRLPEVQATLERAARAAATPLSIHYVNRSEEGLRVTGFGGCNACKHVGQMRDGAQRCRESRLAASVPALRRARPIPFVCHMGFACVSMPALPGSGLGFTLTFGPYCPAEAPETFEQDALWGFCELGHNPEEGLPVGLDDIRFASTDSVPAVAEWTAEALSTLWNVAQSEEESAPEPEEHPHVAPKPHHRARPKSSAASPYDSAHIAAALAGADGVQARKLITAVLTENEGAARVKVAVRRARAAAIVSAVLEAAQRAQLNVDRCWERMPEFLPRIQLARTNDDMLASMMDVLGIIRKRARHTGDDGLIALNRIVMARLADGITLTEVARQIGQHPTAITHRLQRKFGMSFSQYIGQLRVSMAKDLLRCTQLSTGEISLRVGIRDGSNLGKLFRKFEGMSPQEYRQRFGKKEE